MLFNGKRKVKNRIPFVRWCFGEGSDQLWDCLGADSVFLRSGFAPYKERRISEGEPKNNRSRYEAVPKPSRRWDEWQPKKNQIIDFERGVFILWRLSKSNKAGLGSIQKGQILRQAQNDSKLQILKVPKIQVRRHNMGLKPMRSQIHLLHLSQQQNPIWYVSLKS